MRRTRCSKPLTSSGTAPNDDPALERGVELELAFTDLLANGQGVGRTGGIVVFCFGPLPGERARVRVSLVKPRYAVAECVEVLVESAQRVRPFCPVFGACGGCQFQHLSYSAQLEWKRKVVREALQRIGGFGDATVEATIGMAQPRAYRNKMSLVVDHRARPPALGFYRQRSHDVVPIDACPIVVPKLDDDLRRLNALRGDDAVSAMLSDACHLIERATSQNDSSVLTITSARRSERAERAVPVLVRDGPAFAGITNSYDLSSQNAILGRRHRTLAGEAEIEETIAGLRYRFSAASFFQVNVEMVRRIFEQLAPWLGAPRRIVDLYCGVGTFALFFAKHRWDVHGVEENEAAIAEAKGNVLRNGLRDFVRFTTGRVEQLANTGALSKALRETDVLFLDPPRKGSDETTLAAVAAARVPSLWYLSCDPATLARDSKFLVAKGYRLSTVQPFDMFPQTGHVETLVRLEYSQD